MKISAQEEYGLRCLVRLARAAGQSLTIPEIAEAEGLSVPHVAKLLAILRQAGLIESVRGRTGGYRLAAAPAEIKLGTLLLTLGEPLYEEAEYCTRHRGLVEQLCVHHGACSLRGIWQTLEWWIRRALEQISLADLLDSEVHVAELLRQRLAMVLTEPTTTLINLTVPVRRELAGVPAEITK